jgi:chromosome segregation ATPase
MKKNLLIVVSIVALSACTNNKQQGADSAGSTERDSLVEVINQKNSELDDIMGTFNEIQDGLSQITEAEGRVNLAKASAEKPSSAEQIKEDMSFIKDAMAQNKEKIEQLQQKLHNSTFNTTKLQETIEQLKAQMAEQQKQIAELQQELAAKDITIAEQGKNIDALNTNVNDLSAENTRKSSTIDVQDKQINAAWFVFGTKSELSEQRILKRGEVLRNGEFNRDYFTKIDIRAVHEIKLYSKSAKVLTSHPSGSYSLDKDEKGQYSLHITNAQVFWSTTKYLVILVK